MNHLREQWAALVEASAGPANVGFPEGFVFEPPFYNSNMSPGQKVIISHPDLGGAEVEGELLGEIPTTSVLVVRLPGMRPGQVTHVPLRWVRPAVASSQTRHGMARRGVVGHGSARRGRFGTEPSLGAALANLDEIRQELKDHGPDEYGGWACFAIAPMIEKKWGYSAVEGYYAPEGNVTKALDTGRLYTHWWNILPDGRILDATAGQWKRGQGNIEVLPGNDPRYVEWEDIPVSRQDEALDMEQWAFFTGSRHQASKVPVYRGINVEMSHGQFDRYLAEAARGGTGFGFILDIIQGYIPETVGRGKNAGVHWTSSKAEAHEFAMGGPKSPFGIGKYLKGNPYSKGNVAVVMIGEVDAADVVTDPEVLRRYWVLDREREVPLREGASILLRGIEVAVPVSLPDQESWSLGSRDPVRWVPVNGRISLSAAKIPVYRGITIGWMDEDEALNMNSSALRAVVDRVREPVGHHWSTSWMEARGHATGTAALGNTNAEQEMEEGNSFVGVIFHGQVDEADKLSPNDPEWQQINQCQPIFGKGIEGEVTVRAGAKIDVRSAEVTIYSEDGEDIFEVDFTKTVTAAKTAAAKTQKVKDPILGWRWVIVCDFHGVVGRWETEAEAEAALPKHQDEGDLREGSTWRGFTEGDEPIWMRDDVVILTQFRGRARYYEAFIEGRNFRNFDKLDEAQRGVETKVGKPLDWKRVTMPRVWVQHYYFNWTPEFSDPVTIYTAHV